MKIKHIKKTVAVCMAFIVLATTAALSSYLTASAELVNVYTTNNPTFEFAKVYDSRTATGWESSGEMLENDSQSGKYKMKTNAYAFWSAYDGIDFAYVKSPFNTGEGSVLTVETTIDSWDGSGAGSTGICIRNGLAGREDGIYLNARPGVIYFMSRDSAANSVNSGPTKPFNSNYPLQLRIVINYEKKIATGYYNINGIWDTIGNARFKNMAKELYIGVASHSADKTVFSTASWSNFSIKLDAPEGYTIEDDTSSSPEDSSGETEIVLPEDPAPLGDTILSETFTDGNLFPTEKEQSITNPLWTVGIGKPRVMVDEEQTNRYLQLESIDEELVMYAGDDTMTDYSVSADITFDSKTVISTEENLFTILVRARAVPIGGCFDYGISLKNNISANGTLTKQELLLRYRYGDSKYFSDYSGSTGKGTKYYTLKSVVLAEESMIELDVAHRIKVDVFDNTIKVYFDDMNTPIITWDDTDRAEKEYDSANAVNETSYPNLYGKVGISAKNITAKVDNIIVRDLPDVLGGDYDNSIGGIGGSFDQPIPDFIKQKYKRN